jgi:hypothetical protein
VVMIQTSSAVSTLSMVMEPYDQAAGVSRRVRCQTEQRLDGDFLNPGRGARQPSCRYGWNDHRWPAGGEEGWLIGGQAARTFADMLRHPLPLPPLNLAKLSNFGPATANEAPTSPPRRGCLTLTVDGFGRPVATNGGVAQRPRGHERITKFAYENLNGVLLPGGLFSALIAGLVDRRHEEHA